MLEEIGKVKLDYSRYSGEDFYSDGSVEDELLEAAKRLSPLEYPQTIEEKKSWPFLYHLSTQRENIVDWLPLGKDQKVLEVGSGCGAITGALARKAGSVECVDLSKKRSLINAYRHTECENVTIHVGNFKDIEPDLAKDFDYICLIGVLEYGISYIGGENPFVEFVKMLLSHLRQDGRIIIAIENKLGLKYFAGCKEDHLGSFFSGIENYPDGGVVRTFSRRGLEKIFKSAGVKESCFYYPYPDYKFMTTLYSDVYLPGKGELSNNTRNFDRDRMELFNEKNAFDGIVEDGMFPFFSNSFLAVIGKPFETKYAKFSSDRASEYQIKTMIARDENGKISVRKYPLTPAAAEHVRGMEVAYESLKERYAGGKLAINHCKLIDTAEELYAEFEYVTGVTLSELMDRCLEKEDFEGFYALFREYVERTGYHEEMPVADFDLIFSNILVDGDQWTLIDYEWTFGKALDKKELAFRAIYCYLLEDEKRNKINFDLILQELEIDEEDAENYRRQEMEFQHFVTGGNRSMAEMRGLLGNEIYHPTQWVGRFRAQENEYRVQVYEDCGQGFSEEHSYFVKDAYPMEGQLEVKLMADGNVHALRIDPAMCTCVCKLEEILFNGASVSVSDKKIFSTNGTLAVSKEDKEHPSIIFDTADPQIVLQLDALERSAENEIELRMKVTGISKEVAVDLSSAAKKRFW